MTQTVGEVASVGRKRAAVEADRILAGVAMGKQPGWLDLERIISLEVASKLLGLSVDTVKRRHPEIVRKLSTRRLGARLRDVLAAGVACEAWKGKR